MIHTVKGFSVVKEAEVDVFLEFTCFFCDPVDVGNFISGSSVFSKSSLYIWKFLVHVLLKPNLKDFEHYLASMWNERNCIIVWTFLDIALLWDWHENTFSSLIALLPSYGIIINSSSEANIKDWHLVKFWLTQSQGKVKETGFTWLPNTSVCNSEK